MDLSPHFTSAEFTCRCHRSDCPAPTRPSQLLLDKLEVLRERVGSPLQISSGCRCEYWNRFVGGNPTSAHLDGSAVDIVCTDSLFRYRLIRAIHRPDMLFTRWGVGPAFVHVDVSPSHIEEVCWTYYPAVGKGSSARR